MENLTQQKLLEFFNERPQLSAHGFAKEAGISPRLMNYILTGGRALTNRTKQKLLPILRKYGYTHNFKKPLN